MNRANNENHPDGFGNECTHGIEFESNHQKSISHQQALHDINKLLKSRPQDPSALLSKANILSIRGDDFGALECYEKSLYFDKNNATCHYNKGVTLQKLGLVTDAIASYKNAITIECNHLKARLNLSLAENQMGRYQQALFSVEYVLTEDPKNLDAIILKAQTLSKLGNYDAAECEFFKALYLAPNHKKTLENLSSIYIDLRAYKKACDIFQKLIELDESNHEYYCGLGASLQGLGLYQEGISALHKALKLKDNFPDAYYNLALIHHDMGAKDKAEHYYKTAISYNPNHIQSHNNIAYLYLEQFDFNFGWTEYEWRWKSPSFDSPTLSTSKPQWFGQKLKSRLFIWSEQGIGDQVLHGSILRLLEQYPQHITISIDSRLIPAFSRSYPCFTFIDKHLPLSEAEYDEQIPLGSLAKIFIQSSSDLALRKTPYLSANTVLTTAILNHISEPGKILCGLSWKSSNQNFGASKSLLLEDLIPILKNPKFKFINLQYGETDAEIKLMFDKYGLTIHNIDGLDPFDDIDGVISTINACDLVITTSNSTAHLSGALNKDTLLLVPKTKGKLWYWHDLQGISPWYPSIKIYPQKTEGIWKDSVEKINSNLEGFFKR